MKAVEIGRPYGRKLGGTGFDDVAGVGEESFVQTGGYGDDQQPPRRSPDISKRMGQVRADIRKLRLMNSLTDPAEMRRGSRRLDWLETVLLPLKPSLPPADLRRLLYALSLLTGIETLVVLRDICHLNTAQAELVVRWAAQALLTRTVEEAKAKPAVKQRRARNQVE